MNYFRIILLCIFLGPTTYAFSQNKSVQEKMGYPPNSKLLIIHADDVGLSHSVNVATFDAFKNHYISSASIMVPCPWYNEVVDFSKAHPNFDFGLHLTLTSEWKYYKWGPVASANSVKGLINEEGYFYDNVQDVVKHASPAEVEIELRAQIDKALKSGLNPSHMDSHMGTLFSSPEFFQVYLNLAREYDIPAFVPVSYLKGSPLESLITSHEIPINFTAMILPEVSQEHWADFYNEVLAELKPGINEIIIHLGYKDDEMDAICIEHPDYGAEWRQRDFDYVANPELQQALKKHNISLINYGDLKKLKD